MEEDHPRSPRASDPLIFLPLLPLLILQVDLALSLNISFSDYLSPYLSDARSVSARGKKDYMGESERV